MYWIGYLRHLGEICCFRCRSCGSAASTLNVEEFVGLLVLFVGSYCHIAYRQCEPASAAALNGAAMWRGNIAYRQCERASASCLLAGGSGFILVTGR